MRSPVLLTVGYTMLLVWQFLPRTEDPRLGYSPSDVPQNLSWRTKISISVEGVPLEDRAVFWGSGEKQGSGKLPQHIPSWVPGAVPACSGTHVCSSLRAHGNLPTLQQIIKTHLYLICLLELIEFLRSANATVCKASRSLARNN